MSDDCRCVQAERVLCGAEPACWHFGDAYPNCRGCGAGSTTALREAEREVLRAACEWFAVHQTVIFTGSTGDSERALHKAVDAYRAAGGVP